MTAAGFPISFLLISLLLMRKAIGLSAMEVLLPSLYMK